MKIYETDKRGCTLLLVQDVHTEKKLHFSNSQKDFPMRHLPRNGLRKFIGQTENYVACVAGT